MSNRPPESFYRSRVITLLENRFRGIGAGAPRLLGVEVELVSGGRADAIFIETFTGSVRLTVVEVKRGVADAKALLQLMGYMGDVRSALALSDWDDHMVSPVSGLLVGTRLCPDVLEATDDGDFQIGAYRVSEDGTRLIVPGHRRARGRNDKRAKRDLLSLVRLHLEGAASEVAV